MNQCIEILTLSKDVDKELYKTIQSVVSSSKDLSIKQRKTFNYTIVIKNFINSTILEKSRKILKKSKIKFQIISQDSITKVEHKVFKTNGWYEAVYDILRTVKNDSFLWFLNAGDYAKISSLKLILKYYQKALNKKYIGISFLTEVINHKKKFIKPGFFFERKNNTLMVS